jgi:hypothetical protein
MPVAVIGASTQAVSWQLISDRGGRFTDPGPAYYTHANPQRRTRSKIREIERLNPSMKVTLTRSTRQPPSPEPLAERNHPITRHHLRCHSAQPPRQPLPVSGAAPSG